MFNIAQFELIVNIVKTSQGVYALGGLFIYVMYNVKNYGAVKKSATKPVDSLDMEAHGL